MCTYPYITNLTITCALCYTSCVMMTGYFSVCIIYFADLQYRMLCQVPEDHEDERKPTNGRTKLQTFVLTRTQYNFSSFRT